ncbi:MAG TPA: hypothetical protein VF134_03160 [Candidatus Dormibacteraeota bacterium]
MSEFIVYEHRERYDEAPVTAGPESPGRYEREERWSQPPAVPVETPVATTPYNYRAVQVAWFVIGVIVTLIGLRFCLKLLGASTQAEFVAFLYSVTAPLVAPFRGIFADTAQGYFVFEPSSLFAIAIYLLIGWGVVALIRIITAPRHARPLF